MPYNDSDEDLVWGVVNLVAEKEGVETDELEKSLGAVVDAEALKKVVESLNSGHVSFEYLDYEITVAHDGMISVRELTKCDSR